MKAACKADTLMVSLLMLKHIRNINDESVVEQWFENIYYQYFSGEKSYACVVPCEASELVHFRNRIGEKGIELILKKVSVSMVRMVRSREPKPYNCAGKKYYLSHRQ
jgi:hypothetical protein